MHSTRPILVIVLLSVFVGSLSAEPLRKLREEEAIDYMIVVTGAELLSGVYPDGHTHFLTRTMAPLGYHCLGSMCVDDESADICEALQFAASKVKLVLVTGGLGPTDTDITRDVLSQYTGIALREHPQVISGMERWTGRSRDEIPANLRRQARVPERGTYLGNSDGTAVGLVFESPTLTVVALPGPPRELQRMTVESLVPYLSRRYGTRQLGCSTEVRFVGIGQSQIDSTFKRFDLLPPDVVQTSQFEAGRVDFTFSFSDDTAKNRARLNDLQQAIATRLGKYIYATDDTTLEQCILSLLKSHQLTLALAESGSGGAVAASLAQVPDGNGQLAGAVVAPTMDQLLRLLGQANVSSADTNVQLLAEQTARHVGSSCALAVSPVSQSDNGGLQVEAAVFVAGRASHQARFALRGTDTSNQARLVTSLLDFLRRELIEFAPAVAE